MKRITLILGFCGCFVFHSCFLFSSKSRVANYELISASATHSEPNFMIFNSDSRMAYALRYRNADLPDSVLIYTKLVKNNYKRDGLKLLNDSVYGPQTLNKTLKISRKKFDASYASDTIRLKVFKNNKTTDLVYVPSKD